ncbi:hypothetical protein BRC96_00565 [Halobacteriales archaeon QS_6_64_34]|nr:MAG: hypothetical protein BRC96_00565 [Halobacteriales archaeon QS_6_64_34]
MTVDPTEGIKDSLASIDPYKFEQFIADLWERRGWSTDVTSQSHDAGIDVIIEKSKPFNQTQIIQAKRNALDNKVSSSDIQQYSSLQKQVDAADTVIVVTTSGFTAPAKQRAEDLNVKLVDGSTLLQIIADEDAYDLVETYTDSVVNTDTEEKPSEAGNVEAEIHETNQPNEEMSTSEAVLAVIQGLITLAIVLDVLFLIAQTLLF